MNPYRPILDALLALDDKRLAAGALYDRNLGCPCAMGAFIPVETRLRAGMTFSVVTLIQGSYAFTHPAFATYCITRGVDAEVACQVQRLNVATLKALGDLDEEGLKGVRTAYVTNFDGTAKGHAEALARIMEKIR